MEPQSTSPHEPIVESGRALTGAEGKNRKWKEININGSAETGLKSRQEEQAGKMK